MCVESTAGRDEKFFYYIYSCQFEKDFNEKSGELIYKYDKKADEFIYKNEECVRALSYLYKHQFKTRFGFPEESLPRLVPEDEVCYVNLLRAEGSLPYSCGHMMKAYNLYKEEKRQAYDEVIMMQGEVAGEEAYSLRDRIIENIAVQEEKKKRVLLRVKQTLKIPEIKALKEISLIKNAIGYVKSKNRVKNYPIIEKEYYIKSVDMEKVTATFEVDPSETPMIKSLNRVYFIDQPFLSDPIIANNLEFIENNTFVAKNFQYRKKINLPEYPIFKSIKPLMVNFSDSSPFKIKDAIVVKLSSRYIFFSMPRITNIDVVHKLKDQTYYSELVFRNSLINVQLMGELKDYTEKVRLRSFSDVKIKYRPELYYMFVKVDAELCEEFNSKLIPLMEMGEVDERLVGGK